MQTQKQHAKITPEMARIADAIVDGHRRVSSEGLQLLADALRDARLNEAKWWANRTPDRPHSSACALDCIYGARIAALERGEA